MSLASRLQGNLGKPEQRKAPLPAKNYAPSRAAPSRQSLLRHYTAPERRKAPLPRKNQRGPSRGLQRAPGLSQQQRIQLLGLLGRTRRVFSPSGPPPSPDRTTGRELAGFASEAFTGKAPRFVDEANGFFPDVSGALHPRRGTGYGMQAGNPKQQAIAGKNVRQRAINERIENPPSEPPPSPDRTTGRELAGFSSAAFTKPWSQLKGLKNNGFTPSPSAGKFLGYGTQAGNPRQQRMARRMQLERGPVGQLVERLGQSPVGLVAGDIQANRTWAKLAPLFGRDPKKPPPTTFEDVSRYGAIGTESGGKVKLDPSLLNAILFGSKDVAETAAHEYAHTQQRGHGSGSRSEVEGGARAFENAVAPLLGYKPRHDRGRDRYGEWAQQNFSRPGPWKDPRNLRKTLLSQFPHAYSRFTPATQQRRNLAR